MCPLVAIPIKQDCESWSSHPLSAEVKFTYGVSIKAIISQIRMKPGNMPSASYCNARFKRKRCSAIGSRSFLIDVRGYKYFHFHLCCYSMLHHLVLWHSRLRKCTRFSASLSFSQGWYLPNGQHPSHAPASADPMILAWSSMQTGHKVTSASVREIRSRPLPH